MTAPHLCNCSQELKANERQADVKFKMDDAMAAKLRECKKLLIEHVHLDV